MYDDRGNGRRLIVVGMAALAIVATALASEFERPPEIYAPEWMTPFPYQRNIDWSFSQDPRSSPPHYEGWDDGVLWESDYVEFTGDVDWFAELDGYTGVIGIDNRQGIEEKSGTAVFHIDNWNCGHPVKHVWKEIDFFESDPVLADIDEENPLPGGLRIPADFVLTGTWWGEAWQISDVPELWRENAWYKVEPNPPWEELEISFTIQPGHWAVVDRLHIATECIPEPLTLSLLVLGGLLAMRRRP
jgi:hypothetical protein